MQPAVGFEHFRHSLQPQFDLLSRGQADVLVLAGDRVEFPGPAVGDQGKNANNKSDNQSHDNSIGSGSRDVEKKIKPTILGDNRMIGLSVERQWNLHKKRQHRFNAAFIKIVYAMNIPKRNFT
jgi:hypothetical protein